jgi:hypothetical protein
MSIKRRTRAPFGASNDERFMFYVEPEPMSGCHLWSGSTVKDGHGMFNVRRDDGTFLTVFAHRYAYEREHGTIPDGKVVCHKCNVPCCVNPHHLYAGTQKQNVEDAVRAGTHILSRDGANRGERNGRSILTQEIVLQMRKEYAAGGISMKSIGAKYGIKQAAARSAIIGETWPSRR